MITTTCVLHLVRSRKLVHVVAVEIVTDGPAAVRYPHDTTLCGVLVRGEPRDLGMSQVTCVRCAARAASLAAQ